MKVLMVFLCIIVIFSILPSSKVYGACTPSVAYDAISDAVVASLSTGDYFGKSFAVEGSRLLVGAYKNSAFGFSSGLVVVFEEVGGVWEERSQLIGSASAGVFLAQFGLDIGTSPDVPDTVAIGCFDSNYQTIGHAYIFNLRDNDAYPGVYDETAILQPTDGWFSMGFGRWVDLSSSGCVVTMSNSYIPSGSETLPYTQSVFVFQESALHVGDWTQVARLEAMQAGGPIGNKNAIIITDTHVLAAREYDEAVYVWVESSPTTWNAQTDIADAGEAAAYFGFAMAVDADILAVSAYSKDDAVGNNVGAVYMYELVAEVYTFTEKVVHPNPAADDQLGMAISILGNQMVVSTRQYTAGMGTVYHFTYTTSWSADSNTPLTKDLEAHWGSDLILAEGPLVLIGSGSPSGDVGEVYMWQIECIDMCGVNPCLNGGTCESGKFLPSCACPGVFDGSLCDNCICGEIGCTSGQETCDCGDTGLGGLICDEDFDDCSSSPCKNGGSCVDPGQEHSPPQIAFGNMFDCSCTVDFAGDTCETLLDACDSNPCLNNAVCNRTLGYNFTCDCPTGFTGQLCQTNIDECASSPCLNGAVCNEHVGNFSCDCTGTGYEGFNCSVEVDECLSSPCQNSGVCKDKFNDFNCNCKDIPFDGDFCEILTSIGCESSPCLNGDVCRESGDLRSYTCSPSVCMSSPCLYPGSTCVPFDDIDAFDCICSSNGGTIDCEEIVPSSSSSNANVSVATTNNKTWTSSSFIVTSSGTNIIKVVFTFTEFVNESTTVEVLEAELPDVIAQSLDLEKKNIASVNVINVDNSYEVSVTIVLAGDDDVLTQEEAEERIANGALDDIVRNVQIKQDVQEDPAVEKKEDDSAIIIVVIVVLLVVIAGGTIFFLLSKQKKALTNVDKLSMPV